MNETKAIICPACGKLVSSYQEICPHCGLTHPGRKQRLLGTFGFNIRSFVKPIIVVNVIFFILSYALPFFIPTRIPMGRDFLGLIPAPSYVALNLLGWADIRLILAGNWWVLVTAVFLHGGVLHILFNMLWVRDLGPQTEYLFGPHKMFIIFILSGIAGNLVAVFTPFFSNTYLGTQSALLPVIGASGAVFGLMGAIIAFGKKRGGLFGRQLVRQMGMWALILIVMGFLLPGVSNAAHIGGFIAGFVIGQILSFKHKTVGGSTAFWMALGVMGLCGISFLMMAYRALSLISRI
ncbi:rhomboid family intramembrane serine protease [bacterium]|nr:rhomboid family intramembrane serine protease [bacterium]